MRTGTISTANVDGKQIDFSNGVQDHEVGQLIDIDRIVYGDEHHVTPAIIRNWLRKNPYLYCVAKEAISNKIVGYLGLFPLNELAFSKVLQIDFKETTIQSEDIEYYEKSGIYCLYINSVVVSPEYQKFPIVYRNLFGCFIEFVVGLAESDIFFSDACGRATSKEGAKQCKSLLRMQEIAHDSKSGLMIFHSKLLPMSMRLPSDAGRKIYKLYSKKYASMEYRYYGLNLGYGLF